jgi:hypothetical protein
MKKFWTAIDRALWIVPLLATVVAFITMAIVEWTSEPPVLLAGTKPAVRQQFYSSLTSSSGSLLGFTIAAVTILAAFGPKKSPLPEKAHREKALAKARVLVGATLLVTAFLLLGVLLISTILLAIDQADVGSTWLMIVNLSSAFGAAFGLLVGGVGLALAVAERSRA